MEASIAFSEWGLPTVFSEEATRIDLTPPFAPNNNNKQNTNISHVHTLHTKQSYGWRCGSCGLQPAHFVKKCGQLL